MLMKIKAYSFAAYPAMKRWPVLNEMNFVNETRTRIVVVYARSHADRNAYSLTVDSLSTAVCAGVFKGNWKFIGVGAARDYTIFIGSHCGRPMLFDIRKNIPEPEYFKILRTGDVGLSLMISPHPSLPPLDFAAAGLVTVTNSFETKDEESLKAVSSNFIVTEPFISQIVDGLRRAVALSTDIPFRIRGAENFRWERDWNGSMCYGTVLMRKVSKWMKNQDELWDNNNSMKLGYLN